MLKLTKKIKDDILYHAKQCYPEECCGLIVGGEYIPCRNVAKQHNQFEIYYKDWARAEDLAESQNKSIEAIVHSHPDATNKASQLDLLQLEAHGIPWVIVSYSQKDGAVPNDFAVYEPSGYRTPLLGREYIHAYQDCYTLVQDFYARELGIILPNFERRDRWWEDKESPSLYVDNFSQAGFVEVHTTEYKYGDLLICRVGRTEHLNHAVIWLGSQTHFISEESDSCVGNTIILHHPYGRNSTREIFGQSWAERVGLVLRHTEQLENK